MHGDLTEYVSHVYRLALRLTGNVHRAEDLTQETFLRAWQRSLQRTDGCATRAWLFRIAVNLFHDEFRRVRVSPEKKVDQIDAMQEDGTSPDLTAETKDDVAQALGLLDALPERQRIVLYLVAVEDLSLADVCKVLEINVSTAKANLSLARKRMREELLKRESMAKP